MQTQLMRPTANQYPVQRLFIRFFVPTMIICWSSVFGYTSTSAQKLTAEIIACNVSVQARYACFLKQRKGALERAKEIAATRRAILEAQEELRSESLQFTKKQREKNRQEIMRQIEYSRSRNISHKGERYSLTYGYVLELRP